MQSLKEQIIVPAALSDCIKQWTKADYYPHISFMEGVEPVEQWSSSDAWGENRRYGSQHLEWSFVKMAENFQKRIQWHIQAQLNDSLLHYYGSVLFEPLSHVKSTKITVQIDANNIPDDSENEVNSIILNNLEAFQHLMEIQFKLPKLKLVI